MSHSTLDIQALIQTITFAEAKRSVQEKINCWIPIGEGYIVSQQDADAPIITTAHIQRYLLECKKELTEADFHELIRIALKAVAQSDIKPAPNDPSEYHQQYSQLIEMLKEQLPPKLWSDLITPEVVLAPVFLLTMIALASAIPAVAAVANNGELSTVDKNSDGTLTALKIRDYEMTSAIGELALENIKDKGSIARGQDGLISFQERNRADALLLAKDLVALCEPEVTSDKEGRVVSHLLENKKSISELRLIFKHASNKDLLYKIVAQLSHLLYDKVKGQGRSNLKFNTRLAREGQPINSNYLIRFLGETILQMQQSDLAKISHDKLLSMRQMLHLFSAICTKEGRIEVEKQIKTIRSISPPKMNSPSNTASLDIDYKKTIADAYQVENQMKKIVQHSGIEYDKIPADELIQPSVNMKEKKGQGQMERFAQSLVDFYMESLTSEVRETLIQGLLTNSSLMQPLNIALRDARNKPLLHKIVARLTHVLYDKIKAGKVENAESLTFSLGAAIMDIEPEELREVSTEEIDSIKKMLLLYKKRYSTQIDKEAVTSKQKAFRSFLNSLTHSDNQEVVETDNPHTESSFSQESVVEPASSALSTLVFYGVPTTILSLILVRTFSTPPEEIHVSIKETIQNLRLATLSYEQSHSYNERWLAKMHYGVAKQSGLSLLALPDQEVLLKNLLSTQEVTVTVAASKENIQIIVKARHWLPKWDVYMGCLKKIDFSSYAKKIEMPDSFVLEIYALLKTYFSVISNQYKKDLELQVTWDRGVVLMFSIYHYPYLLQDLNVIFKNNKLGAVEVLADGENLKIKINFPLNVLVREEGLEFEDSFAKNIIKANAEALAQIEVRKINFLNTNKIIGSLKALHFEQHNITYRARESNFDWVLESNRSYLFGNEAIEIDSFASILQYVLRKLYALEATIEVEGNNSIVSHAYFVGNAGDKQVEANALIQDSINSFTRLRQHYKPAVCKLLYEDGEIKIQVSLHASSNIFEGMSKQEFFNFMKEELKEKNVLAKNIKKSGGSTVVFSLSPPQPALSEFKCTFEEFCIEKRENIRRTEEAAVKAKEKVLSEEKLKPVLQELNDFLADITGSQFPKLKWQMNGEAIELTLHERLYYAQNSLGSERRGIEISRNAFSLLILNYLGQARGVAKEYIITKQNTLQIKNPIQSLSNPPTLHVLPFKRLSVLAELYAPMRISLIAEEGKLHVGFKLASECDIPLGLDADKFVNCVLRSLMAAKIEEKDITQKDDKFRIPLEKIMSNECSLSNKAEFFTGIQADLEKEEPQVMKEKEPTEIGEMVSAEVTSKMDKGKEEVAGPNAIIPESVYEQPLQLVQKKPDLLGVDKKFDLDKTLQFIRGFLPSTENEIAQEQSAAEKASMWGLYKGLCVLMEILNEVNKGTSKLYSAVPKWFKNIKDPEHLSSFRVYIIKGFSVNGYSDFIKLAASRLVNIKSASINLRNIINEGLPAAKNKNFNALEITVDYDDIIRNVETLKGFEKSGEAIWNIDAWVRKNIHMVQAVLIQTYELFKIKKLQSPNEIKQELGLELYHMLDNARYMRNSVAHLELLLGSPEIMEETSFIINLNNLGKAIPKPGYGAGSSRLFREEPLSSGSSSSSSSGYTPSRG